MKPQLPTSRASSTSHEPIAQTAMNHSYQSNPRSRDMGHRLDFSTQISVKRTCMISARLSWFVSRLKGKGMKTSMTPTTTTTSAIPCSRMHQINCQLVELLCQPIVRIGLYSVSDRVLDDVSRYYVGNLVLLYGKLAVICSSHSGVPDLGHLVQAPSHRPFDPIDSASS